jgi:YHS domain-containing protein
MRVLCTVLALAAALVTALGAVWAQEPARREAPVAPSVKEMQGNVCPVLGGPINKKFSYTYKGTIYYFCCPACIEKFKAEPEKYVGKESQK